MGAVVQDHRMAYGLIMEPSGKNIPLGIEKGEAVTVMALSRHDASFVALGTENGNVQVYSVDSDGNNIDSWIDAHISGKAIVALEFVPPPSTGGRTSFTSSLVALTRNGNLIALDVFDTSNSMNEGETTRLLPSNHQPGNQHGTYRIQSSLKLADVMTGSSEQPTGAMVILDDKQDKPLVVLGMSGGTLLVMARKFDLEGYTWDCVKQLSLPSAALALALSTHGANSMSKYPMLAAGLEDGEVALMDAAAASAATGDHGLPPGSPFHFLRAHNDDGIPVSRLHFYWCQSSDKGGRQLHLAIVSASLLRIANMSTFEVFYAYHAGSRILDICFCTDGPERILVARDDNVTESVSWSPWKFIYGER